MVETTQEGGSYLLREGGADITGSHFDPAWWASSGRIVGRAAGRGQVCFVRANDGVWALRHYRRGGWIARLSDDRYLWTGLDNTRPWREWKLTAALHDMGLPVPRPVAARVIRDGLFYRGDLVTRRIESAQALADLLAVQPMTLAAWRDLGALLRRFHDAGVRHDDINARNVLIGADGKFHLIDFDKAAIVAGGDWKARNLARFRRSLEKFARLSSGFRFSGPDWDALVAGYG